MIAVTVNSAFNRTILELKLHPRSAAKLRAHTFNRTILELKYKKRNGLAGYVAF